jgi:hypothetical protein
MAGPRCADRRGPLAASSVSWLVPSVCSRGQAIRVGLISTGRSRHSNGDTTDVHPTMSFQRDALRGASGSVVASAAVAHPVAIDEIH